MLALRGISKRFGAVQALSDVDLTVMRNDLGFADVGVTGNQRAVAAAAEKLGSGNPIYEAVLWLDAPGAQQAFDDLSGESYASLETLNLENASRVADAATGRVDRLFDTPPQANQPAPKGGIWGQVYGARDLMSSGYTTASLDGTTGGLIGETFVFVLPGSRGACRDAWEGILRAQLDNRHQPCNFVELMPRLAER